MSPDRDLGRPEEDELDLEAYDDEEPRSIFSALWFRALLAILVLGVLAAVAVPYVLDFATPPALKGTAAKPPATGPVAQATATPATATPAPAPVPTAAPALTPTATAAPVSTPVETATPAAVPAKPAPAPPAPTAAKPRPMAVAKADDTPKASAKASAVKPEAGKTVAASTAGGPYWVQVGAYKDAGTARQVAARLREQGLRVGESTTTPAGSRPAAPPAQPAADLYEVVVAGASTADLDAKLGSKGLTAEATPNGIVVKPSLPLRDAVALSRDLADAGLRVQVRRMATAQPVAMATPDTGPTLYRVRVGGFPDRATAVAAMKELEDKGYKPFIARGE